MGCCCKKGCCKKRPPRPDVPRGRVIGVALVFEIVTFVFITVAFYSPYWQIETSTIGYNTESPRQTTYYSGLWYQLICPKQQECRTYANIIDKDLNWCRVTSIIAWVCVTVTMGIFPLLRPPSDNALKVFLIIYNLIAVSMSLTAAIIIPGYPRHPNAMTSFPWCRLMMVLGGFTCLVTASLTVVSLKQMFKESAARTANQSVTDEDDTDEE